MKMFQPLAIFVVGKVTLVALANLRLDLHPMQLKQESLRKSKLTTKDPKRFGYLKCLDLFCRNPRKKNGSWIVVVQGT